MWPFTRGEKNLGDITKDLDPSVQDFFLETAPESKPSIFQEPEQEKRVNEVLAREDKWVEKYGQNDYEFDKYRHAFPYEKAAQINCVELQQCVLDCFHDWKKLNFYLCKPEIATASRCADLQRQALSKLHYKNCYNIPHCQYIRYIADELFVKNFGKLGSEVNDETNEQFLRDLDEAFWKAWI